MSFTVNLKHKEFGEIVIKNVTEIHYCYPSVIGKSIAFESDVDGTGCTYPISDVIEFEAVQQCVQPTPPNVEIKIDYGVSKAARDSKRARKAAGG